MERLLYKIETFWTGVSKVGEVIVKFFSLQESLISRLEWISLSDQYLKHY